MCAKCECVLDKSYKNLGKIRPTAEGEHDINNSYSILSIVTFNNSVYISRQDVPNNIDINNDEYWVLLIKDNAKISFKFKIENKQLFVSYDNGKTWESIGTIDINGTIIVDDEDIELVKVDDKNIIKFKDRDTTKGKGYIILRTEEPIAEQMTQENTIYEIRYDFDLGGGTLDVPANCVLDFKGGSFKNGIMVGHNASLLSYPTYNIFNDTVIKDFNLSYVDVRWFGAVSDFVSENNRGTDSSFAFQRALDNAVMYHIGVPIVVLGNYYIATPIETTVDLNIRGTHSPAKRLIDWGSNNSPDAIYKSPSHIFVAPNITAFTIIGIGNEEVENKTSTHITVDSLKIESEDNTSNFIKCLTFGAPSRPGFCRNTEASGFNNVFEFNFKDGASLHGTNYYNFTLGDGCNFFSNTNSIYCKGRDVTSPSLGGTSIQNSVLEQGARIAMYNLFGFNQIKNNLLEGQNNPINVSVNIGHLEISGNYLEQNTGSINLTTQSPYADLRIKDNYVYNCPDLKLNIYGFNLKELDTAFVASNVYLTNVNVFDRDALSYLRASSIASVQASKFPTFDIYYHNTYKSPTNFNQSIRLVYDYLPTIKVSDKNDTIIVQNFYHNGHSQNYLWGLNFLDVSLSEDNFVVVSFYKATNGRINFFIFDENQNANGFPSQVNVLPDAGYYAFSFKAPRDTSKIGIRVYDSVTGHTTQLSQPTISVFENIDAAKNVSLKDVCVIRADAYQAATYGTTNQRPVAGYYYNNFNKTKGFTYFDTDLNKMIVFNGNKWVNLDGTDLT